jgi:hypothetical protein
MKWLYLLALTLTVPLTLQGQLSVGESSKDTTFALFDSSGELQNTNLSSFNGKVVVAYYYTPW